MNTYEQKQADRRERFADRAISLRAKSDAAYKRSDMSEASSGIPFGQPILVGHHSEGKHRRAIERSHNAMRKSVELDKEASRCERIANTVSTAISSDDPDAIKKLKAKLTTLEEVQSRAKEMNRVWRMVEKKPEAPATIKALAGLNDKDRSIVQEFKRGYSWEKGPIESYAMSNNNANMATVKKRIKVLEAVQDRETTETTTNGVRVVQNTEENRVQLFFDGKPSAEVRSTLKQHAFRWAPSHGAWQRQLTNAGIYAAECVLKTIAE